MDADNPSCQQCYAEFSNIAVPLLLPDCGHSVCSECIQNYLKSGKIVTCKEDGIQSINRTQLSDFPKNFALLQLIGKNINSQRTQRVSANNIQPQLEQVAIDFQDDSINFDKSSSSNSDRNYQSNSTTHATKQRMVDEFVRKQLNSKNTSLDALSDNNSNQAPVEMKDRCLIHRKKNEILCVQCKLKICSNCALFGGHKSHEVTPIEDAIQKITKTVEDLIELFQSVEEARSEILSDSFQCTIKHHLSEHTYELLSIVDNIFKDIHEQVDERRSKLEAEISKKVNQMEAACLSHLNDLMLDASGKADLWCMTTKAKLIYFKDKIDIGEIPIDLFQSQENNTDQILVLGEQVLKDLDHSKHIASSKMKELGQRKLAIEYKGEFNKLLEGLFYLSLKTNDSDNEQNIISKDLMNSSGRRSSQYPKESASAQSFMKMMVGEVSSGDIFLLKDINNSSLFIDSFSNIQNSHRFQDVINFQETTTAPKKVSFQPPDVTINKNRRVSPQPGKRRGNSKPKLPKIPEKYQIVLEGLYNDTLESADFTGAQIGDEGLSQLIPLIVQSTRLRILKLSKNKISDQGAVSLLKAVLAEQNKDQFSVPTNIIASVNLSSNILTDKTVEFVLELCRNYSDSIHVQSLRSLQMSLNLINAQKVKKKVEELKKIGVNLQA